MDRVNISTTATMIRKEFGFDKITLGFIFSAFTFAYSLGQVPGGWIGDRFGPRKVLPALVTFWSVMTIATAQAGSLVQWIIIRALFGAGGARIHTRHYAQRHQNWRGHSSADQRNHHGEAGLAMGVLYFRADRRNLVGH